MFIENEIGFVIIIEVRDCMYYILHPIQPINNSSLLFNSTCIFFIIPPNFIPMHSFKCDKLADRQASLYVFFRIPMKLTALLMNK